MIHFFQVGAFRNQHRLQEQRYHRPSQALDELSSLWGSTSSQPNPTAPYTDSLSPFQRMAPDTILAGHSSSSVMAGGIDQAPANIDNFGGFKVRKEYSCQYCYKVFNHKNNFLKHERTHTGEKPFVCLYCDHRNSRSDTLRNHIKKMHPEICL